jgi:hypothetical protein
MYRRIALIVVAALVVTTLATINLTSAVSKSVMVGVSSAGDDGRHDGSRFIANEPVALIGAGDGRSPNVAGFLFKNVQVPPGSTITSVEFSLVKSSTEWSTVVANLAFAAQANTTSLSQTFTSLPTTRAKAGHNDNIKREDGRRYKLGDSSALGRSLSEVVSLSDWKAGNSLLLVVSGPANPAWARQKFYMRDAGTARAPQLVIKYQSADGGGTVTVTQTVTGTATQTQTATGTTTSTATGTVTSTAPATGTASATATASQTATATVTHDHGQTPGNCGESTTQWHPAIVNGCATGHEHGDPPPQWVYDAGYNPAHQHAANTPNENQAKPTSFKGFSMTFSGVQLYGIFHIDSNPSGHTSRFHSYQIWAKDPSGNVSHWHGWMDFGTDNMTGPQLRTTCQSDTVRPIMFVNDEGCGALKFENWYSRAGGSGQWSWDFGFNIKPQYYTGGDPANRDTWAPTGQMNDVRRVEAAWYSSRPHPTGAFWATQFGQIVSGPNDPVCGTSVSYGSKSYTVLCLEQYIAPTMVTVGFPGNALQKTYDMNGVSLPN